MKRLTDYELQRLTDYELYLEQRKSEVLCVRIIIACVAFVIALILTLWW